MYNYNLSKKQKGLNLIELMIALTLGIIVIFGVTRSLVALSVNSRIQSRNAELQETAESALSYIAFKLHSALSTPCERYSKMDAANLTIQPLAGNVDSETISAGDATIIEGLINNLGINVTPTAVARSFGGTPTNINTDDITTISIADRLFPTTAVDFTVTTINFNDTFAKTRAGNTTLYAITDCKAMDIFRASRSESAAATTLTLAGAVINRAYRPGDLSIVSPLEVTTISVNANRQLLDNTLFIPSGGSLLDNIELIRVLFGVDHTGDGITDQYITAGQLTSMPVDTAVMSADVYMMVRATGRDAAYSNSYQLQMPNTTAAITGGTPVMETFTITDQIPRRVFMRSVVFRNNAITL